jgi:hypothetical protein
MAMFHALRSTSEMRGVPSPPSPLSHAGRGGDSRSDTSTRILPSAEPTVGQAFRPVEGDAASSGADRAKALPYESAGQSDPILLSPLEGEGGIHAAYHLLCELRHAGISLTPAGDRLAVSARGRIPEEIRAQIREQKPALLRLLRDATTIARAQTADIIARRVEAGMELLWDMELAGRTEEPEYARHLAMYLVVLCALDLRDFMDYRLDLHSRFLSGSLALQRPGRVPPRN